MLDCYVKKKNGQKPKANKVALHAHIENYLIFCMSCSLVKWGWDYRTRAKDLKGNIPNTLCLDFLTLYYILKFY